MKTTLSPEKLHELVSEIRDTAVNNQFKIQRDNKKEPWKNKLLSVISDDAVRNHLMCLHPFQYHGYAATTGVLEFKVNWYSEGIYLKVDLDSREVLSFHYDDMPLSRQSKEKVSYRKLQVITEKKNYRDIARFAIGSSVTSIPINIMYEDDGSQWIMAQEYLGVLKGIATSAQLAALDRIGCISDEVMLQLIGPAKDYGFLSYTEGQLRLISTCYDVWRNNRENIWLRDEMLDLILQQDEKIQKQFAEQLYKDAPSLPLTKEF